MFVVTIDTEPCGGCGECVSTCPGQMFELVDGKAQVRDDAEECLGCQSCVIVCSSGCITMEEY